VQDDLARLALRLGLEPEAQPAVGLVGALEVATVSAKTKKLVVSPRIEDSRSISRWYSWSSIIFRRSRETYLGAFP
jgi:hypothetical protein